MRSLSIALALTAAILVGGVNVAEEPAGVPEKVVKDLEYLVGTWEFEGKTGDDVMAGTVSYRWARSKGKEKYALLENWSYKEGGTPVTGVGLMGWNAAWNCLVESGCNSAGDCFMTHWVGKSPTEWQGEFTDSIAGKEVEGRGVLVKKGPAEFVYEGEFTTGKTSRVVFRKVTKERKPRKAREKRQQSGN
jgi:hypothetical protein